MRTVDVYNSNYDTNATNVKDALETYGNAWFSSVTLDIDTTSSVEHAHVKCYVQSQVDPVIDIDFTPNQTAVYHISSYDVNCSNSQTRMHKILFTDNGIVLKRRTNSGASHADTFIIGKDVAGNLCGYYMSQNSNTSYVQEDQDTYGETLRPTIVQLTPPTYRWRISATVGQNDAANPYVIAYPFASRYGVSDKIWRIQDSFYYKAKTVPFMISMNNKTYLTLANGSMIIETT